MFAKEPVKTVKRQTTDGKKVFSNHISDEKLVCRT